MSKRFFICGGGTGGHIFPALAIGHALKELDSTCQVLYIGTKYGLEKKIIPATGEKLITLPMRGLLGKSIWNKLQLLWRIPMSLVLSLWHLFRWRPAAVLGVGGYASLPMAFCASILGKPCVVQEQNAFPGLANKLVSRFAKLACLGFEEAKSGLHCPSLVTGNPVREKFYKVSKSDQDRKTVLILGGSQGAMSLNKMIPEMLKDLDLGQLKVVHQCGPKHLYAVQEAYSGAPFEVDVVAFIEDVADVLASTRFVISRSGASTVSELEAAKVPAFFIPFPQATHDHQTHNAKALASHGCASWIQESELSRAKSTLQKWISDDNTIKAMRQKFPPEKPPAARICADILQRLAKGEKPKAFLKEFHTYVPEN